MENNKMIIPIVLSADRLYAMPLAATIASIVANKKVGHIFEIYILDGGLGPDDKKKLTSFCSEDVLIYFIKVDEETFTLFPEKRHLKIATYYRLIAPEMVNYEKIIYLDSDIIVNFDLADLYRIDLLAQTVAAVRDVSEGYVKKYFFRPISRYFNAGVLLIDTKKWQEQNIRDKAVAFIKDNIGKVRYADQDILNHLLENDWFELDDSFNFQLDKHQPYNDNKKINILHFVGARKPWHYLYSNGYKRYFLKYLKLGPYSDYKYPDKNFKTFLQRYLLEPIFIFFKNTVRKIAPKFMFRKLKSIFWHFSNLRDSR